MNKQVHKFVMERGGYLSNDRLGLKLAEEVGELCKALLRKDKANTREELCDVFFNATVLANKIGINDTKATKLALQKYLRRGDNQRGVHGHRGRLR